MLLAFNKPYGVLSQFSPDGSKNRTLADFGFPENVYPLGRLDADSEGLLLLSDEKALNNRLLNPRHRHARIYWALIERVPGAPALQQLESGIEVKGMKTLPASVRVLNPQPQFPPRDPPVRYRKSVEDIWIELALTEGRNRQVRKMCAAVEHPVLRLVRVAIGGFQLGALMPGKWVELDANAREQIFQASPKPGPY